MKILGIDPGTRIVGFGLIERVGNSRFAAVEYGNIKIDKNLRFSDKLKYIYNNVSELIKRTQPDITAVEEVFVSNNAKTTLRLGHARGVIILAAAQAGISVEEYAPREVKQAVVGFGNASKSQIQHMVIRILELTDTGLQEDTADSLAVALCCGLRGLRDVKIPEKKQ